jgi:uncharacterized protein (TIGR03086 family)
MSTPQSPPDPRDLYRRAAAMTTGIVAAIPAGQLDAPTPCSAWDVRRLIGHVAGGSLRFAAVVTGAEVPPPGQDADLTGDDPAGTVRDALDQLGAAFDSDGFLDRMFPTPIGAGPGRVVVALRICELAVHSWDLAAATGQPRDLDPDVVGFADGFFRNGPVPRGESGPFGPEQPVGPDAPPADRLAAFAGRPVPAR